MKKLARVILLLLVMAMVIPMTSVNIFAEGGSTAAVDHTSLTALGQSIYSTGEFTEASSGSFDLNGKLDIENEPYVHVTNGRVVTKTGIKDTNTSNKYPDYRYYNYSKAAKIEKEVNADNAKYYSDFDYYVGQDGDNVYLFIKATSPENLTNTIYNIRLGFDPSNYGRAIYFNTLTDSSYGCRILDADGNSATNIKTMAEFNGSQYVKVSGTQNLEIKLNKNAIKNVYKEYFSEDVAKNIDFKTMFVSISVAHTFSKTYYGVNYGAFYNSDSKELTDYGLTERAIPDVIVFGEDKSTTGTCTDGANCEFTGHTVDPKYLVSNLTGADEDTKTYYHTCKNGCGRVSAKTFEADKDGNVKYEEIKSSSALCPDQEGKTCGSDVEYFLSCRTCGALSEEKFTESLVHNWVGEAIEENIVTEANCTTGAVYKEYCINCSSVSETDTWEDTDSKDAHIQYAENTDNPDKPGKKYRYTVAEKEPTCIAFGWEEYVKCEACGYSEFEDKKIASLRWTNGEVGDDHTGLTHLGQSIYSTGEFTEASLGSFNLDGAFDADNEPYVHVTDGRAVTKTGISGEYKYCANASSGSANMTKTGENPVIFSDINYYVGQDEENVYLLITDIDSSGTYHIRLGFDPKNYGRVIYFTTDTSSYFCRILDADNAKATNIRTIFADGTFYTKEAKNIEIKLSKAKIEEAYKKLGTDAANNIDYKTMFVSVNAKQSGSFVNYGAFLDPEEAADNGFVELAIPDVIVFGVEKSGKAFAGCSFTSHTPDEKYLVSRTKPDENGNGTATFYHSCQNYAVDENGEPTDNICGAIGASTFVVSYTANIADQEEITYEYGALIYSEETPYDADITDSVDDCNPTCVTVGKYYYSCSCGIIDPNKTTTFEVAPLGHIAETTVYETNGTEHWLVCERCDVEGIVLPDGATATPHEFNGKDILENQSNIVDKDFVPTCMEGYSYYMYCVCGLTVKDVGIYEEGQIPAEFIFEDVDSRDTAIDGRGHKWVSDEDEDGEPDFVAGDDGIHHYYECLIPGCTAVKDIETHNFDIDNICEDCGYEGTYVPGGSSGVVGGDSSGDVTIPEDTTVPGDTTDPEDTTGSDDTAGADDTGAVDTDVVDTDDDTTVAPETDNQDDSSDDTQADDTSCEGTVTFAGLAIVATLGLCATFVAKKKEDDE